MEQKGNWSRLELGGELMICDDDCFNCKFPDCVKTRHLVADKNKARRREQTKSDYFSEVKRVDRKIEVNQNTFRRAKLRELFINQEAVNNLGAWWLSKKIKKEAK